MDNILYFFLPAIIIFGFTTSYTDVKQGKIKNKMIIASILYILITYTFLFFFFGVRVNKEYLLQSIFNLVFALIAGFVMWDIGLWTAGDGKLFLGYSALVPIFVYNLPSFVPYFPSLNLLVNTFVPLFIFFFFNLMVKTSWKKKKESLKKVFDLKRLGGFFVSLFAFMWVFRVVFSFTGFFLNYAVSIFLFFVLFVLLEKFSLKQHFFAVLIGVLALFSPITYTTAFWKLFILWFFIFLVTRFFILDLGFQKFTSVVKIDDLKEGMIPAEIVYKDKGKLTKKQFLHFSLFEYLIEERSKGVIDAKSEGLTKKDISRLNQLTKKHPDLKTFRIQQTLPFAPFMFFGVILTFVSNGSFLIFLKMLLVNFI